MSLANMQTKQALSTAPIVSLAGTHRQFPARFVPSVKQVNIKIAEANLDARDVKWVLFRRQLVLLSATIASQEDSRTPLLNLYVLAARSVNTRTSRERPSALIAKPADIQQARMLPGASSVKLALNSLIRASPGA